MELKRSAFFTSLLGLGLFSKAAKAQEPAPPITRDDVSQIARQEIVMSSAQERRFTNGGRCPTCRAHNLKWNEEEQRSVPGTPDVDVLGLLRRDFDQHSLQAIESFVLLKICQHCGTVYQPQNVEEQK
jgi:uncharacterized protein with PIN domain